MTDSDTTVRALESCTARVVNEPDHGAVQLRYDCRSSARAALCRSRNLRTKPDERFTLESPAAKLETTRIIYTMREAGLFPPCAERSLELLVETLSTSGIISWELA